MDEHALLELAQKRENLRLPKRNNLKRKQDEYECPVDISECSECGVNDRLEVDTDTNRIKCHACGFERDAWFDPRNKRAAIELTSMACVDCGSRSVVDADLVTGEYHCDRCGVVSRVPARPIVGYHDSAYPRGASNARLNYFKERMSQWCRKEPPIPHEVVVKLRATYRELRNSTGPDRITEFLNKSEVRCVVITAGLPPKKLVEKWLTIRYLLKGSDDCPTPSPDLVGRLIARYRAFLQAWTENPGLRDGRNSLPNINFLIVNFLLLESVSDFDLYGPWFPQVTQSKRAVLWQIWLRFCVVLDWDIYTAEYDSEGRVRRIKQQRL